jgi:large subunit ribosomal protein L9e
MKTIKSCVSINVPKGINIDIKARTVTVSKGDKKLSKSFKHLPVHIQIVDAGRKLEVSLFFGLSKQIASLRTVCSHIDNMITGVTQRFRYHLRLVYNHFPINAQVTNGGKTIEIRNFLGEKSTRVIDMVGDAKVSKSEAVKDEILVEGPNIDDTSRSAALIHQSCLVKRKDIRMFLDGIYVSQKGAIVQE